MPTTFRIEALGGSCMQLRSEAGYVPQGLIRDGRAEGSQNAGEHVSTARRGKSRSLAAVDQHTSLVA